MLFRASSWRLIFVGFVINFLDFSNTHQLCCLERNNTLSTNVFQDKACADSTNTSLDCAPEDIIVQLVVNYTLGDSHFIVYANDGSFIPLKKYCLGTIKNDFQPPSVAVLVCREKITRPVAGGCQDEDCHVVRSIFELLKILSAIMIFVSAAIYMVLRKLRDLQGSCILNFLICHFFVYTIANNVLHLDLLVEFEVVCPTAAYLLYFFALSASGWLCISIFNAWKNLISWNSHYIVTYIVYLILVYGGTGVCLFVIITIQHYDTNVIPNFSNNTDCWFASGDQERFWFSLPIEMSLVVDALFLIDCGRRAWQILLCVNKIDNVPAMKVLIKNCSISFKLYLAVIYTRIITVLLANTSTGNLLQFLESIQGILMFIILIISEKGTRKALSDYRHYGCNLFPTTWTPVSTGNRGSSQPRYCTQNEELTDVDLTLRSSRTVLGRRHTSLGA